MKIPLDPPPWDGCTAVMATWEEGGCRRFALAGRSDIVTAQTVGGDMMLFPERSSAHKALAAALSDGHSGTSSMASLA